MARKCKKCGKKFDDYHALGGHASAHKTKAYRTAKGRRMCAARFGKRTLSNSVRQYKYGAIKINSKVQSNGQPDMATMREHGRKYLEVEREILLRQVDQLDQALKLMQS
jgi:hypothetical protein